MTEPRELLMGYCGVCGVWTVHSRPQHKKMDKFKCTICEKRVKKVGEKTKYYPDPVVSAF